MARAFDEMTGRRRPAQGWLRHPEAMAGYRAPGTFQRPPQPGRAAVPPHRHHLRGLWRQRSHRAADPVRHHPAGDDQAGMARPGARPRAARDRAQRLPEPTSTASAGMLQGRHRSRPTSIYRNPCFRPEMMGLPCRTTSTSISPASTSCAPTRTTSTCSRTMPAPRRACPTCWRTAK